MALRRERRSVAAAPRLAAAATTAAQTATDPVDAAAHGELRALLRDRIDALPDPYRTVLVLQLENGLGAADIARALGCSHATVRSQLHRGLDLLRRALPADLVDHRADRRDLRSGRATVLAAAGIPNTVIALGLGATAMLKKSLAVTAVALAAFAVWWSNTAAPTPVPPTVESIPLAAAAPQPTAAPVDVESARIVASTPVAVGPTRLRVHVKWPDDTPAAAMDVWLRPQQHAADWFAQTRAATGGDGIAQFEDLAAGRVTVQTDRGGEAAVTVAAGATTDIDLPIPLGIDARGLVVGPDGNAVPGAIVAIGRRTDAVLEAVRCDGNGAFFLRALAPQTIVAAFAEGYAASEATVASAFADGPKQLRLLDVAGCVTGRVVDDAGRPIAGAWVAHGYDQIESRALGHVSAMRTAVTAVDGTFVLEAVPLGQPWPLHACARGFAWWRGTVRPVRGKREVVEVRLVRAVTLAGTCRDPSGAGLRAFVHVVDANSPGNNIADQRPSWARAFVETDAQGTFAFQHLPPGDLLAAAEDRRGGSASRSFAAQPGDALQWDPVVRSDRAIRGRVVDVDGTALAGWRVYARGGEGVLEPRDDETAADGSFALVNAADAAYTVSAVAPGDGWHDPVTQVRGVTPGGEPLLLRVGRDALPSCFVCGTLADGQPDGVHILLVGARGGYQMRGPLQPGVAFEIGPVPPGRYALQLQQTTGATHAMKVVGALSDCDLQFGERHELGTISLPVPTELAVDLVDGTDRPIAQATITFALVGAAMGGIDVVIRAGHGTAQVPPGRYIVSRCDGDLHVEHAPFEVEAGHRTALRLQTAPAVVRQVCFDTTAIGHTRAFADWKKNGVTLRRTWYDFWHERPVTLDTCFTPGAWELELELANGAVHRFPFFVSADAEAPPIEIVVPR